MIVRDEARVIARALRSVRSYVGAWCVVDTGSVDATPAIVVDELGELPGELHRRPWVNFGHNRTEALELARAHGSHAFLIDADEVLAARDGARLEENGPAYVRGRYVADLTVSWLRPALIPLDLPWRYEGATHEALICDRPFDRWSLLEDFEIHGYTDGARRPRKFAEDAAILRAHLVDQPEDARAWFYLGESLRNAGDLDGALVAYQRRGELGGWAEECAMAHYARGLIAEELKGRAEVDVERVRWHNRAARFWTESIRANPRRAEPFWRLARLWRLEGAFALALPYARAAAACRLYPDALFVEESVYRWRALDELAVILMHLDERLEAAELNRELLGREGLTAADRERITRNLELCD
jgi:glycosyltransferase involved in cell wall biosynthesis